MFFIFIFFLPNIQAFRNPFTRSESTQLKERCGYSILLNNNYWLLKQTYQALKTLQNPSTILPWSRLSNSIEQIYHACLVDDIKSSKERLYLHQTAIQAGTLLAKKAKDITNSTFIKTR